MQQKFTDFKTVPFIRDYPFITYVCVRIRGLEMLIFSENFVYVRNGWYLSHIVLSSKSGGKGLGIQLFTKVFLWKYFFGLLSSKKNLCYLLDWKPFKNDEKCFFFILKTLFVPKIFMFLPWLFGHVGKMTWLTVLTSKFMTSQPAQQTIAIHILPIISQSKVN